MEISLAPNVTIDQSFEPFVCNFVNISESVYRGKTKLDAPLLEREFTHCKCNRNILMPDYSGLTVAFIKNFGTTFNVLERCSDPECVIKFDEMKNKASKKSLEIFKTENCGWGLRTKDTIYSYEYICEYVGELWLEKEYPDERSGLYSFSVENNNCKFIYDSEKEGNFSRMINHSCNPNAIGVFCCFRDDLRYKGKKIPQLGIFAGNGIIEAGKEIFIDYSEKYFVDGFKCLCGNDNCVSKKKE
uniref:SET domain-containing protein n=1 Tax=Parastrongyloides trichosuri TaxID=131310 RepID=A0A0N5A503_PARTI